MSEYLASHPGVPYGELVELLGRDFAVDQLLSVQLEESKKRNEFERAMADSLARRINEMPNGWTGQRDFPTISALSMWHGTFATTSSSEEIRTYLKRIQKALLEELRPPVGWKASGPDDEFIQRAFELANGSQ